MPERINSFDSAISGVIFVSLATIAVNFGNLARAKDACIEHPPQSVAEGTHQSVHNDFAFCNFCHTANTEVSHWDVRYDRATGRRCWFLVDAQGRDVTEAHAAETATPPQTQMQMLSSTFASLFNIFSFTEPSADATPAAPAATPAAPADATPANSSHDSAPKRPPANANKTDNAVRVSLKNNSEGQAAKRVTVPPPERDLFEEFLRWREMNKR
jgi:hypothetical protein